MGSDSAGMCQVVGAMREIPTEAEWGDRSDFEVKWALKRFGGKSVEEVWTLFRDDPIETGLEGLHFAPTRVFLYYIAAFVRVIMDDTTRNSELAATIANAFLSLVASRAEEEPETILECWEEIEPALMRLANHQSDFDADVRVYGRFDDWVAEIRSKVGK